MTSRLRARLLLALAGGLLHAAATPPIGWWPLVFLAPVLLLRALRGAKAREGAAVGLAWGAAALALPARWVVSVALARHEGLGLALAALAVLVAGPGLFGFLHGLGTAETGGGARRSPEPFLALLWVGIEWLRGRVPIAPCSWFTLAHALGDGSARPLCQAGTIAGPAGLSLLVFAAALLLERGLASVRERPGHGVVLVTAGVGLPVIVWELGFYVLVSAVPIEAAPRTALQVVIVQDGSAPEAKILITARGLERARRERTPHVDVLLWPGDAYPRDPLASGALEPDLRLVAGAFRRAFVLGCLRPVAGRLAPSVLALRRDGVEIGERRTGDAPWIVDCGSERLGVLFGLESDDEGAARALVAQGATMLAVAASEPPEWPREAHLQHALHASLRACEVRRPLVRAARAGPSFGLDELARPYCLLPDGAPGVLIARLGGLGERTLHVRAGHFLPQVALLVAGAWLSLGYFARRSSKYAEAALSATR